MKDCQLTMRLHETKDDQSWARSRNAAKDLLENPSPGDLMPVIEARFLEPHSILKNELIIFADGGPLGLRLRRELLSYGLSLLVLKRLESKHHLVSQKAGFGRAASVPHICRDQADAKWRLDAARV